MRGLFIFLFIPLLANAQSAVITTVAGNGAPANSSNTTGSAVSTPIGWPEGLTTDTKGNLYIVDWTNSCIRKVDAVTGMMTTICGNAGYKTYGDWDPDKNAFIKHPHAIAFDADGNFYFTDDTYVIRRVTPAGIISTYAGNHLPGNSGDGGPATNASILYPFGLAIAPNGDLYFSDHDNNVVRKVSAKTKVITRVAGTGEAGYKGDGGSAINAMLHGPRGIGFDSLGNLYIADEYNNVIRKVDAHGVMTTFAGNGFIGNDGDGGPATAASLDSPNVYVRGANVYIISGNVIRSVSADGIITTIAGNGVAGYGGDGGPATAAQLNAPWGMTVDSKGDVYISDFNNYRIRKIHFEEAQPERKADVITLSASSSENKLTITSSGKITSVAIKDVAGKTVYYSVYNSNKVEINVANLPSGIFYVQINDTEVRRFVKE